MAAKRVGVPRPLKTREYLIVYGTREAEKG
jgi:hypothetical protein